MKRQIEFTDATKALFSALFVGFTLGGNSVPREKKGGTIREIVMAEAAILAKLKAISRERERTELELLQITDLATAKQIDVETADSMVPRERVLTTAPCVLELTQAEHERLERYLDAYPGWLTTGAEQVAMLFDLVGAAAKVDA